MKRRVIMAAILWSTLLPVAWAGNDGLSGLPRNGVVRFYVYHVDEFLEVRYAENGRWLPSAEARFRQLFRSRGEGAEFTIDRRLIELADHLQDYFGADTVEVISAYRSPAFNKSLKDAGRNVANESFHTKGLAMDIHLDEIREDTLRDYLLSLKLGGVGYYGNKLMVHMDFGPVRRWQDGGFTENIEIGVFNEKSTYKIRTDKLYYYEGEGVTVSFVPPANGNPRPTLEKFVRGKWQRAQGWQVREIGGAWRIVIPRADSGQLTRFGKFRLRFETGGDWQNSNEFYVKRI